MITPVEVARGITQATARGFFAGAGLESRTALPQWLAQVVSKRRGFDGTSLALHRMTYVVFRWREPMLTRMFSAMSSVSRPFTGGVVALALLGTAVSFEPAHGGEGIVVLNCVGSGFAISCVKRWRSDPYLQRLPRPSDAQEEAESAERERKWAARCRPVMKEDRYGVSRYEYAAQGCEFGKTKD